VLTAAAENRLSAKAARDAAAALHAQTGRTAGNGSLMRTAPVALANLDNPYKLQQAARGISDLTHADPDAGDACVLWCSAIRHAVLTGQLDVRIGLPYIPDERREVWQSRIAEAEQARPADFTTTNGWVVAALQGAWSAISATPVPAEDPAAGVFAADHLRLALEAAVRGGGDTDTVAAIAGGLLGAAYGASAVPWQWRLILKGWPGLNTHGLVALADRIINGGEPDRFDHSYESWRGSPPPRPHPHDDGVLLGAATTLPRVPGDVGAVVSLCRVADGHIPADVRHLEVRLIDQIGANANLGLVLLDTVRAIEELRAEGHTVFLHSLTADGRTPAVAALYGARRAGVDVDAALDEVCAKLPDSQPNREFLAALRRLDPATERTGR